MADAVWKSFQILELDLMPSGSIDVRVPVQVMPMTQVQELSVIRMGRSRADGKQFLSEAWRKALVDEVFATKRSHLSSWLVLDSV
jgi:hypothetical protein